MHEMTIAEGLLGQVLAAAAAHGAGRVSEIEVVTGELRLVVPEALTAAFEVVSAGTPAEGAVLTIVPEPIVARCRACGNEFACGVDRFACDLCGQADVMFVAGNDIILKSLTAESAEEAEAE